MHRLRALSWLGLLLAGCAGPGGRTPATAPRNWSQARPATLPWPGDPYAPRTGAADGSAPITWNGPIVPGRVAPYGPQRPFVLRRPDPNSATKRPDWLLAAETARSSFTLTKHQTEEPETLPVAMTVHVFPDHEPDGTMLASAGSARGPLSRRGRLVSAGAALRDEETHPAHAELADDRPAPAAPAREALPGAVEAEPERSGPSRPVPQEPPFPPEFITPQTPARFRPREETRANPGAEREPLPAALEADSHERPAERASASPDLDAMPEAAESGTPRPRRVAPTPPLAGRPRRTVATPPRPTTPPMPDPSLPYVPGNRRQTQPIDATSGGRSTTPTAAAPPAPPAVQTSRPAWGRGLFRRWRERRTASEIGSARGELSDVTQRR